MPDDDTSELHSLRNLLRAFVTARDWDQFHSPKNLATALSVEAAELLEPFQWLSHGGHAELGKEKHAAVRHELADVFAYLILLSDKLDIDLADALKEKITLNEKKYRADLVRGDARKYSDY